MTANNNDNAGNGCGNPFAVQLSLLLSFPGVFCFYRQAVARRLPTRMTMEETAMATPLLCNGLSFGLFPVFYRQAATQRLPTRTTMLVTFVATSCCATVFPFSFPGIFLFLEGRQQLDDCRQ